MNEVCESSVDCDISNIYHGQQLIQVSIKYSLLLCNKLESVYYHRYGITDVNTLLNPRHCFWGFSNNSRIASLLVQIAIETLEKRCKLCSELIIKTPERPQWLVG